MSSSAYTIAIYDILSVTCENPGWTSSEPYYNSFYCNIDTLGIRLPVDFANFYQIAQSTSGTESYSEGFTLIASILYKIVSSTVSERT